MNQYNSIEINRYSYGHNNVLNFKDPTGLSALSEIWQIVKFVAIASIRIVARLGWSIAKKYALTLFRFAKRILKYVFKDKDKEPDTVETTTVNSIDDIFNNPISLMKDEESVVEPGFVEGLLENRDQWDIDTLRRGSQQGKGRVFREKAGPDTYTDRMLQYHPGGGHHGPNPYWKVSSAKGGTVRVGPDFKDFMEK